MATTFTYLASTTLTAAATTASSNLLTVAASANGSWGVAIGAVLSHANIPVGTTILSYNSATQAVMSQNATITGSGLTVTATNPANINIANVPGVVKTGGDIYNISGPIFTIDQDSRFGFNEINTSVTAASTLGTITISATLGGTIEIDSRYVRLIPFNTGSGTITAGSTITCGSATGKVIGIYSALNTAPVLTGVATGWIKVKAWNSIAFPTSGTFTQAGYTFTITGADTAGFLVIQGDEASTVNANRLGIFRMQGTYYDLGTTSGARGTTYQVPFNGSAVDIASIEVETSPGSDVYEAYLCANTITAVAANMATDWRGKVFWLARTTGILRFGHDGTNLLGGYLPVSGCKIRMYNLITANNTAAARQTIAVPNATVATRYDFTSTGAGTLIFDKVNLAWYPSFVQAYTVTMNEVSVVDSMVISENATFWNPNKLVIGPGPSTTVQTALNFALMPEGVTFDNCTFGRLNAASAGVYTVTCNDVGNVIVNNTKSVYLTVQGNVGVGGWGLTRCNSLVFNTGCIFQRLYIQQTNALRVYSPIVYNHPATATASANGMSGISLAYVNDFIIDGWDNGGLNMCQPFASLIDANSKSSNGVVKNIGTYASPYKMGGDLANVTYTRSTTTATVTHTAHGLITGCTVNVLISDSVAAIVLGQKTITVTGVNTYTFTALNAGATSGSLQLVPSTVGLLFSTGTSAANSNITVRRCYFTGGRGSTLTFGDNGSSNYTIENVYDMNLFNSGTNALLNTNPKGTAWIGTTTGQSGVYGAHWFDHYMYRLMPSMSALPYTRSTTTATVTLADHNLYTGAILNITVRSDSASIPQLGPVTITALTRNTFTFTCTNAGTASGTITVVNCDSRFNLMMNEPTSLTSSLVNVISGAANFTAVGTCLLPNIGDTVEIATGSFYKGYTEFTQNTPVMTGGTITNFNVTYDIDVGSGYSGVFKNLSRTQVCSGTSGQFALTVQDSSLLAVDDAVYGTSIAGLAKITTINSPTQVTLDKAHTGTISSGLIQFGYVHNETVTAVTGFKFKWRLQRRAAGVDAITGMYIRLASDAAARQIQYPLPGILLTLTGLVPGSDVVVLEAGTTNILDSVDSNGTSSWSYSYTTQRSIDIGILKQGYVPLYIRNYSLGSTNASLPVSQAADRNYI